MTDPIVEIALELLFESPFNPRRMFGDAGLQELAADIKAHGRILQPLLVRPRLPNVLRTEHDPDDGYELVFGHRRLRGAEIAGMATAPCMVRSMTDEQVRRAQISENLSREDVHPIEEAEGYRALMDAHGVTVEQLVEQTGKSRSYIYGRLKLMDATDPVRHACLAGEIGSETALLIARVPKGLQAKALQAIKAHNNDLRDGGKNSYRRIRSVLMDEFALDLKKDALWDLADALLLPDAGACSTCPSRSGCTPELFGDVVNGADDPHYWGKAGADVCTDPECFAKKKKAHLARKAAELEQKGKTVIEGNAARQAISAHGEVKGAFVALKDVKDQLAKARQNAQKNSKVVPPQVVLIQDPRTGKTVEAVRKAELEKAGVKLQEPKAKSGGAARDWEAEQRERQERANAENAVRFEVLRRVVAAAIERQRTAEDLRLVAADLLDSIHDTNDEPAFEEVYGRGPIAVGAGLDKMSPDELGVLMLTVALCRDVVAGGWDVAAMPDALWDHAERFGVDVDQVRAEVAAGASTPSPAARAAEEGAEEPRQPTRVLSESEWPFPKPLGAGSAGDEQMDDDRSAVEKASA